MSLLAVAGLIWVGSALFLAVAAFRVSAVWGLLTVFVPFGALVFVCKHWGKGGVPFIVSVLGCAACQIIVITQLDTFAPYLQHYPALVAALRKSPLAPTPPPPPPEVPKKREAVDVAGSESLLSQRDSIITLQAAYDRHAAELGATYEQLKAVRAKLKGGGPALAAYNAKAAHYQDSLRTLAAEKASLDALQHSVVTATARTVANTGQGPAAGASSGGPPATRAAMDIAVQRVRAIINQVPPTVAKPTGAESWNYGFHPGATKPDFDTADLVGGRELWLHDYIDMQGAPNVYYRGPDCEFNSQTKFFYTNRELPKKRLTDAEIQEVVRLYRFLGKCQRDLGVTL